MKKRRDLLKKMWDMQRKFGDLHYDTDNMDDDARDAKTREIALALHHEVSKLVSALNFRRHVKSKKTPDVEKILYESVDIVRYVTAICNVWDIDHDDFYDAWEDKDGYLNEEYRLENTEWSGEPVIVCDIDDVFAEFRADFSKWVGKKYDIALDPHSPEYFFIEKLAESDHSSLSLFDEFINDRQLATLTTNGVIQVLNHFHDKGCWIHIVTARPEENLTCRYDTSHWLRESELKYDALSFTGEKLSHVTRTRYSIDRKIVCCIDDGPNHCMSYVTHGYQTCMPIKSYNGHVGEYPNLHRYKEPDELYDVVKRLYDAGTD